MLTWRRQTVASWGRWCQGELHFCMSHSPLCDCPAPFSELELEVAGLREGVDEVVAFVHV
jgi:hypothetical protein